MNLINQNIEFLLLDYRHLKLFQGDLKKVDKSEYRKLENSLKKKGNFDVIRVWLKEKTYYILDGHTRVQFFKDKKVKFDNGYDVPCVVIHAENPMATTVRMNRAKGTHGVLKMAEIVQKQMELGMNADDICNSFGMEMEEVIRLANHQGIPKSSVIQGVTLSKAWEPK